MLFRSDNQITGTSSDNPDGFASILGDEKPKTIGAVDLNSDTLDLGADHGYANGDAIVYSNGGGASIGGLENGKTYYIINDTTNANRVKLAATRADAISGRAVNRAVASMETRKGPRVSIRERILPDAAVGWLKNASRMSELPGAD